MAHLHPVTTDTVTFTSVLPPLPAGPYRVFADIVQQSGFTQTLTSTVMVPNVATTSVLTDTDDSWHVSGSSPLARATLDDGSILIWLHDVFQPIRADGDADLRFRVESPPGDTATRELYLGMPGHAAVVRDDGKVFIHLHPMGTISPAAQARLTPVSSGGQGHAPMSAAVSSMDVLHFPYAFPGPGRYTIWVQLKRGGRILTGSFQATVE
jgi:hypothetical protein